MLVYATFNGTIKNVYKSASEMATLDVLIFPLVFIRLQDVKALGYNPFIIYTELKANKQELYYMVSENTGFCLDFFF